MNVTRLNRLVNILNNTTTTLNIMWGDIDLAACADPEFASEGLSVDTLNRPVYAGRVGHNAIIAFFDLTNTQAEYLFAYYHYQNETDPQTVIARIHKLLGDDLRGLVEYEVSYAGGVGVECFVAALDPNVEIAPQAESVAREHATSSGLDFCRVLEIKTHLDGDWLYHRNGDYS